MLKIISVVGARPNFMKVAPIHDAINNYNKKNADSNQKKIDHKICHTGQHYDEKMSQVFFDQLGLPKPDFYLGIGGGSHAEQTAKIMIEFEKVLIEEKPNLLIVVGDVNSTIACSLTAAKLGIKIAHVEAGLRSYDRAMPEEINRLLTDTISDYLFVTEPSGLENLKKEGIDDSKVHFVGHVMIDSLIKFLPKADTSDILELFGLEKQNYILTTMHRPSNVDVAENLKEMILMFNRFAEKKKVVFPIHPRTRKNIESHGLMGELSPNLILTDPIGYIDFIALIKNAELILTDSGGIQEESTYLGVQCITIRRTTERPVTVTVGTNQLVGDNFNEAESVANRVLNGELKKGKIPELWDGKAAERIVEVLVREML
ncbi:MAG: UDP-N-acetylglucosamine 2-epimerase (non-hydrolyzing) [Ignavibacteria bacterium]|nr:UDP-N-acetylglucosamine 2-epimerase (non-hydrolyzing) [Ignavibacteria bacterium]